MMLDCWNDDPSMRPPFSELVRSLDLILTMSASEVYKFIADNIEYVLVKLH